jgi:Tfp pilus assembly protein PilF
MNQHKGENSQHGGPADEAFELTAFTSRSYKDELQCPICETVYNLTTNAPLTLPCGHDVCTKEVEGFKAQQNFRCPTCRAMHPSSCQFKMNIPILQTIDSLNEILTCPKHKKKIVEACLYERKLLCRECATTEDHKAHKKDTLAIFMEKMRAARNWRKDIEESLSLTNEDIIAVVEARKLELKNQLDEILTEAGINKASFERIRTKLIDDIDNYFAELTKNVTFTKSLTKCRFALPAHFLELELKNDLEYGIYQMELDEVKTELDKWAFRVKKDELIKGLKEKLNQIIINIGDDETEPSLEFRNSVAKFEFPKYMAGEYDLLGGILSGITGIMYLKKRKFESSLENFKKARLLCKIFFEQTHPIVGRCCHGIGASYALMGQTEKTLKYQRKALSIFQKTLGENHPDVADCYHSIGTAHRTEGKYDEALKFYWKAADIKRFNFGDVDPSLVPIYNAIGNVLRIQMKYKEAYDIHKIALEIAKDHYGPYHPQVADSYDDMGVTQTYLLNTEVALDYLLKGLEIRKQNYGENHPSVANSYNNLGLVYKIEGNYKDALDNYKLSLKLRTSTLGENNPSTATIYNNMGVIYRNMNNYDEAIKCHKKALEIRIQIFGETHLEVTKVYNSLGKAYFAKGDREQGKENFIKSYAIAKKAVGPGHQETQKYLKNILKLDPTFNPDSV